MRGEMGEDNRISSNRSKFLPFQKDLDISFLVFLPKSFSRVGWVGGKVPRLPASAFFVGF